MKSYDALVVVSFGGPERREDVLPFLENVTRGRGVPRERLLEVAGHYYHLGGHSPINDQNRALITALEDELAARGPRLPVYWGNRNWHPLLADTLREMREAGVRRALAFVTSAFGSYSGCRQYLDDIARACEEAGPGAPDVDKLRVFYNHPGFIEPMIENVARALEELPTGRLVFTAHSVPVVMAGASPYVAQLEEACRLVAAGVGRAEWRLVYQSRSGAPGQPWLEPDVGDYIGQIRSDVVLAPIGFVSDHLEVVYDLDAKVRALCDQLGVRMARAGTVGAHPKFVGMIRELILERTSGLAPRALGSHGPSPDTCAEECCRISHR